MEKIQEQNEHLGWGYEKRNWIKMEDGRWKCEKTGRIDTDEDFERRKASRARSLELLGKPVE